MTHILSTKISSPRLLSWPVKRRLGDFRVAFPPADGRHGHARVGIRQDHLKLWRWSIGGETWWNFLLENWRTIFLAVDRKIGKDQIQWRWSKWWERFEKT